MNNAQLLLVLVAFCIIVLWRDGHHFLRARRRHSLRKQPTPKTNYDIILDAIGDCKSTEELDNVEAKACSLLLKDYDHSLTINSALLIEHFSLKRYTLLGMLREAEECADKIEAILFKMNICHSL